MAALGGVLPAFAARLPHGEFAVFCTLSHRSMDDPIVFPGRPGASHRHDFFGNPTTDAASTAASLAAAGGTTCTNAHDHCAYWTPTVSVHGRAVTPGTLQAYYVQNGRPAGTIRAFPAGFRMIAGNPMTRKAQSTRVVSWGCAGTAIRDRRTPPVCAGADLELHVRFPDCWDGVHLDIADHRSHMAYSRRGRCPSSRPVAVPSLQLRFDYAVHAAGVRLSSGAATTAHADFFNAWEPAALGDLVRRCVAAGVACGG